MNGSTPLNLGMMMGFGRMDGDTLRVFQSHYEPHGYRLTLAPTARRPEYDYEPIAVAYRLTGGVDGVPQFEAIEVTRSDRTLFPKENTGGWYRTKVYAENDAELEAATPRLAFRPFGTDADLYEPAPAVIAALVDRCVWSPDLLDRISGEPLLEAAFFAPQGTSSRFPNQWVGAGSLIQGEFTRGRNRDDTQTYNFVWARFALGLNPQPGEDFEVVIASAVPGFSRLRQVTLDNRRMPMVMTARIHYSPKKVPDGQIARLAVTATELLVPTPEDFGWSSRSSATSNGAQDETEAAQEQGHARAG